MARASKPKPTAKSSSRWRRLIIGLLTTAGIIFLTAFTMAHWTQRQLLTTDNWVKLVAPLPKNDEVASALSQYSVDKLFESIDVEQKISDALPPRVEFLAPPLSERVQTRATQLAKNVVQSDQFQGAWIAANRVAHERLVDAARGEVEPPQERQKTAFGLKLENLLSSIKEKLGSSSSELFAGAKEREQSVSLSVDLKSRFANFKRFVNTVDFLNGTLLLAATACLIGASSLSRSRRRLFMTMLTVIAVIALLQLIGVKALRPTVLNHIQEDAFRPAIGVVYDELLASFQRGATAIFAISTLTVTGLFIAARSLVSKNKFLRKWLRELKGTGIWQASHQLRRWIGKYRWYVTGVGAFLVLAFMAFVPDFDWQGVVRAVLAILIVLGLVNLFSLPTVRNRSKAPAAK